MVLYIIIWFYISLKKTISKNWFNSTFKRQNFNTVFRILWFFRPSFYFVILPQEAVVPNIKQKNHFKKLVLFNYIFILSFSFLGPVKKRKQQQQQNSNKNRFKKQNKYIIFCWFCQLYSFMKKYTNIFNINFLIFISHHWGPQHRKPGPQIFQSLQKL